VPYRDFRGSLTPRYGVVWLQLLAGHMALAVATVGIAAACGRWPSMVPFIVITGAWIYGYAQAYIVLFLHEAAHYNIARDRALNDRLANIFIGVLVGQNITEYRSTHFDHHRYLGTPTDTEHAYFDPLNVTFLAESLTGIKTLKMLALRNRMAHRTLESQLVVAALVHGTIMAAAVLLGYWPVALAWTIGIVIVFPFLAAIRQLLEHRSEDASPDVDYALVPHGAVNRMFGSGLLASTFGGAGFNRHLLHHWEPQISYTRLRDLEQFLLDTPAAHLVDRRRTSYAGTFLLLFNRARRG
jgi:fatty acid desaturase